MALSWDCCILCQRETKEDLRCPLRTNGNIQGASKVYDLFLNNALEFKKLDALPIDVSIGNLSTDSLIENKASWHKSCHLQFSLSKLNKTRERVNRKRKDEQTKQDDEVGAPQTRWLSSLPVKENCILCGEANPDHQVTTFAANDNIHQMILELQDSTLLPRVCGFDLMAEEAKYHMKRITELRNRYKKLTLKQRQETCEREEEKVTESQAFIELVDYKRSSAENDKLMFLLSELHTMYVKRLATLGVHKTVNKTRLKN